MFKTSGKIQWFKDQKPGWYSVKIEDDLSKYYRWFCLKGNRGWNLPMNGPHVTFIAGEKEDKSIIDLSLLLNWINKEIEIEYDGVVCTDGKSYWIDCSSLQLDQIRSGLGLGQKKLGYHITLGNNKNKGFA